jgi:transcriptional regulator with XRE-family HTH domain
MYPGIKSIVAERGLKLKYVASQLGWHPSYLSQIIHGHRVPKRGDLIRLSTFLGIPVSGLRVAKSVRK